MDSSKFANLILFASVALLSIMVIAVLLVISLWCHQVGEWWTFPMEATLLVWAWKFAVFAYSGFLSAWDFMTGMDEQ